MINCEQKKKNMWIDIETEVHCRVQWKLNTDKHWKYNRNKEIICIPMRKVILDWFKSNKHFVTTQYIFFFFHFSWCELIRKWTFSSNVAAVVELLLCFFFFSFSKMDYQINQKSRKFSFWFFHFSFLVLVLLCM